MVILQPDFFFLWGCAQFTHLPMPANLNRKHLYGAPLVRLLDPILEVKKKTIIVMILRINMLTDEFFESFYYND